MNPLCKGMLTLTLLVGAMQCGCARREEPSNRVVLYCSVDQAIAEPIIADYEGRTGQRVLVRFDTEASKTVGLVQRLRAEQSRPRADVFWSSEVFYTIRLAREGLFQSYHCDLTEGWPAAYADADGLWYGFGLRARSIAYNTRRVPVDRAPRSLEALLDQQWRGRIVMARPEFGTTGGDVASWFAHYGAERAMEILKSLQANGLRLVSGNSAAVRQVAHGQADICLTDTDDVYAAQRNGWPVAHFPLDQSGRGALAIPNTVALIEGGPHPQAARQLMAYLLSHPVEEQLWASDSHNCSIRTSAEACGAYHIGKTLPIPYAEIADHLREAIQGAREIFH